MFIGIIAKGQDFEYFFLTDEYQLYFTLFDDFDNDQYTDIISLEYVSNSPSKLLLFKNKSTINNIEMEDSYIDNSIEAIGPVVSGDFDNDGDIDIVLSMNFDNPTLTFLSNDGTAAFQQYPQGIKRFKRLITSDFDNDGDYDLIGANGSVLTLMTNDGTGSFSVQDSFDTGTSIYRIYAADFDNDNDGDIVFYHKEIEERNVQLLKNKGGFDFVSETIYNGGLALKKIVVKDFNRDGKVDITMNNKNNLICFINQGDMNFIQETIIEDNSYFASLDEFDLGDMDNDGDVDIIIEDGTRGLVYYKNVNGETFGEFEDTVIWDEKSLFDITLRDFTNDNKLDIYVASVFSNGIVLNKLKIDRTTDNNLNNMEIYPVPAEDKVHIKANDSRIIELSLYDITGNRLMNVDVNQFGYDLDISGLIPGIYMARIHTSKGVSVRKIIKK